VLPRTHTNCTNEIPAILNGTNVFVDPISFVIKAAAVRCNDVAPLRWRLTGDGTAHSRRSGTVPSWGGSP
jgi:hypothetical protein